MEEWQYKPANDLGISEVERLRSVKRESGLVGFLARNTWWFWVRVILRITERIRVQGTENLPAAPPFLIVANHASHLDVLVLATALPLRLRDSVFPLAAGDTFFETAPMAAFAAGMMNCLPMWRKNCGRHAIDALRHRLVSEPCGYILFPEGTRSRTGQMGPFRSGVGMLVAGTVVPVIPCNLQGTFDALPPHANWPRPTKIALSIGKPCQFRDISNEKHGWQAIADKLEQEVRGLSASPGTSMRPEGGVSPRIPYGKPVGNACSIPTLGSGGFARLFGEGVGTEHAEVVDAFEGGGFGDETFRQVDYQREMRALSSLVSGSWRSSKPARAHSCCMREFSPSM